VRLSVFIATQNGVTRNPPGAFSDLLRDMSQLADELVVVVDYTTTDDTFEIAARFTKNVYRFSHDPMFVEMRRQSFSRCTGDWILWLDDDDRLSPAWTRPAVERLMNQRTVTHYWVPALYMVSNGGLHLSTAPFIVHFMTQLYRNIESIAIFPTKLHQQMAFAGEPAYLAGLYVEPMNFVWHDRKSRELKLDAYDEAYDEEGTGFDQRRFYLYEDHYFETRHVDEGFEPKVMAALEEGDAEAGVHVRLLDVPERMTCSQTYWVTVRISNNSERMLLPQSELLRWGTLAVSYHWSGGAIEVTDAVTIRTPFPARIAPRHEHDALIRVKAPDAPGLYRLQPDILEENTQWFSRSAQSGMYESRDVEVVPLVWPPRIAAQQTE